MDYSKLSIADYIRGLRSGKFTAMEAVEFFVNRCKSDEHNAILEVFESWKIHAKRIDTKIKNGEKLGRLVGVPIVIKDNILYENHKASSASKILGSLVSPYSSTIVRRLLEEDAILTARANMDEFAMGGTGSHNSKGQVLNAHDTTKIAGGSSGGSAVALARGYCLVALGSDTGGSVRQPAAYNGVYGIKPTYGSVSRYGIISFGSSIEQVGVFANSAHDLKAVFDVISGHDPMDATSLKITDSAPIAKPKIGYIKEIADAFAKTPYAGTYETALKTLEATYGKTVPLSIPGLTQTALPVYYIIAMVEAASNMARYDGVRFTDIPEEIANTQSLEQLYTATRSELFGDEVKRRILLGNFLLCQGHNLSDLYKKAKSFQHELISSFEESFKKVNAIVMPITYGPAPEVGALSDPVMEYLEDLFTVPANLVHIPSIAVPCAKVNGMPMGIQIMGKKFSENLLFKIAEEVK